MDKNGKLQRYDRKDYSELVDFPVEIVGRDGVVRRYTFEDSIRLYQRRITFAPIRYRDVDLIRAEASHCRARIGQLRRSYFHRYGWGTPKGHSSAEDQFGDFAGELAAFLCRVLDVDGRPELQLERLTAGEGPGGPSTWYVSRPAPGRGMLLYFHRFDPSGDRDASQDRTRDQFFASIRDLQVARAQEGDAERLIAFHHNVDCGFVLTGRAGDHPGEPRAAGESRPVEVAPTPWDEVMEVVRRGDHDAALRRCRALVREQPWHRNAYVAGAMLASFLEEHVIGDELALVGTRYFPSDGPLHYYVGLCRMRLGRYVDARQAFETALRLSPGHVAARAQLVILLLQTRHHKEARQLLAEGRCVPPDDKRAHHDLLSLEQWIRWRSWMVQSGAFSMVVGAVLAAAGSAPFVAFAAITIGATLALLGWFAFRRQLDQVVDRQRFEEISSGLRRLHRQTRQPPVIS